jgi:UV DNA damage endonuclease
MFPWMSEYQFEDLPNFIEIKDTLEKVGKYVLDNDMRVGFHPGQFCVLPSPTPKVVDNTINELDKSAKILDLMGLPINHKFSLNIHVGGSYGDKESTLKRFVENFSRLSSSAKSRLVIENDDKASQYSVVDLYEGLHKHINIPITFDFFHHLFCTGDLDQDAAAKLAASTWPDNIRPLAHYSSSRKIHEDSKVVNRSHADYIYEKMPVISKIFDIEIEAKSKELALLKYIKVN